VTLTDFKGSLKHDRPSVDAASAVAALWWIRKGNWDRAHEIVMNDEGTDAAWVHAHLHRIEGDLPNAQYWYKQARKPVATTAIEDEWEAIAEALLAK